MIKIEYSLLLRKPSADVLSYTEYVNQNGDDHAKTELAYMLDLDRQLYALYPTLKQPTTGLEIDKEYMMFDNWDLYQAFEQKLVEMYDQRAQAVFKLGMRYSLANNIYVSRVVREIDEQGQTHELMNGFVDYE
jgi:cellulose synthase/poly-beta-1,6-N-acetylglucosamine synthase-like glycosyltransferase